VTLCAGRQFAGVSWLAGCLATWSSAYTAGSVRKASSAEHMPGMNSSCRGGASHVTTVDVAEAAIASAGANWELNGLDPSRHEGVVSKGAGGCLHLHHVSRGCWAV
jgi:hypothetical protein